MGPEALPRERLGCVGPARGNLRPQTTCLNAAGCPEHTQPSTYGRGSDTPVGDAEAKHVQACANISALSQRCTR